jgi:hypothetical protein
VQGHPSGPRSLVWVLVTALTVRYMYVASHRRAGGLHRHVWSGCDRRTARRIPTRACLDPAQRLTGTPRSLVQPNQINSVRTAQCTSITGSGPAGSCQQNSCEVQICRTPAVVVVPSEYSYSYQHRSLRVPLYSTRCICMQGTQTPESRPVRVRRCIPTSS